MMERPHWSFSQITCFQRCPLQFYFRYIRGMPRTFVPSSMVLGSAVHAGLAAYHRGLMHGKVVPFASLEQSFLDSWQTQEDNSRISYRPGQSAGELQQVGLDLLKRYTDEPPPERIRCVEKPLYVPLHTSTGLVLERPLLAVADLITETDEGLVVHEFKTSSRAYTALETDLSLQARCYVHAAEETWGQPATVRFTVLLKTKKPRIQRLDTVRDVHNASRLGDIVHHIERAVRVDAFYPHETAMNCGTCPYRRPCLEWGREQTAPPKILTLSTNGHARC